MIDTESNRCTIRYNSVGDLLTKPQRPFNELFNCSKKICGHGEYRCKINHYCIETHNICDGISHCLSGDDEMGCGIFFF